MQPNLSIVVHTRPTPVTRERRRAVLRELDRLESIDLLEYEVRTWPAEVEVDDASSELLSLVRKFDRWSERRDVSITPPFERRTYERPMTGESGEVLTLPGVVLAAYDGDDDLVTVVPHTGDEGHVTVDDYVGWLRATTGADGPGERIAAR